MVESSIQVFADWPQWRGPERNGISSDTTSIRESFPDTGPTKLWESGFIPSDHDGGHGSPLIAGERVYLSVVWHEQVVSDQRVITNDVMQKLNYRQVTPELAAKLEQAREGMNARLRGDKLEQWITEWTRENLDEKEKLALSAWIGTRFRAGRTALPLNELRRVHARLDQPFDNADALRKWLEEEQFSEGLREKLLAAVPNTIKQARDVLVCLNLNNGEELWRYEGPGLPVGRNASSTAAVVDGRVYAIGSTHLYAVDAEHGKELWKTPLPRKGPAASPLVADGKVFVAAGSTLAFDADTGKQLWEQKETRSDTASPQWWQPTSGKPVLLSTANSRSLHGLDPATGEILWSIPGGGQSTPVTQGDWLVFYSGTQDVGIRACRSVADGPPEVIWSKYWPARRYMGSPIIHEDQVYLFCGEKQQCFNLQTGETLWQESVNSSITSPVLADGKLLVLENNGSHLRIVADDPAAYRLLSRSRVDAMGCTTPALSNGRLVVRLREKLVCFDLRPDH